jgi:hypothetical protein
LFVFIVVHAPNFPLLEDLGRCSHLIIVCLSLWLCCLFDWLTPQVHVCLLCLHFSYEAWLKMTHGVVCIVIMWYADSLHVGLSFNAETYHCSCSEFFLNIRSILVDLELVNRGLFEMLMITQLAKKYFTLYVLEGSTSGTLFWTRWIQYTSSQSMSLGLFLILSYSLFLCLPNGLQNILTKILYEFLISHIHVTCPTISFCLIWWPWRRRQQQQHNNTIQYSTMKNNAIKILIKMLITGKEYCTNIMLLIMPFCSFKWVSGNL